MVKLNTELIITITYIMRKIELLISRRENLEKLPQIKTTVATTWWTVQFGASRHGDGAEQVSICINACLFKFFYFYFYMEKKHSTTDHPS